MKKHNGKFDLTVTAINCGSGYVRVENVSEDFRNYSPEATKLRFHGRNSMLALERSETWAVLYESCPDEDGAPVVLTYPDGKYAGFACNDRGLAESLTVEVLASDEPLERRFCG